MYNIRLIIYFFLLASFCACQQPLNRLPNIANSTHKDLSISSDDTTLVTVFQWASNTSKNYVGNDLDPVGPWYEAALPGREAFCMRDISHQCIGEEINNHGRQNLNMFTRFVENISEEKDFCTYWEISKDNLPASVDYENDEDFWYNLNANFDLLDACYRLYLWTGNPQYVEDPRFFNFYRLTCGEYIKRWQLSADSIMYREGIMNVRGDENKKRFKGVRGLPSYEESVPNLKVTGDLLASIFRGLNSYASILSLHGEKYEASKIRRKAEDYIQLYDSLWWNPKTKNYFAYCLDDGTFKEGGTNIFPLWFGFVHSPERIESIIRLMETKETNVEIMSYCPLLFYRYGKAEQAYTFIQKLFQNERCDYPEVSSALLESIVCGTAGLQVKADENKIVTYPQLTKQTSWLAIENIPVLTGKISLIHYSNYKTAIVNKTDKSFIWRAVFPGKLKQISESGRALKLFVQKDALGNVSTYAEIICPVGEMIVLEGFN